MKNTVLMLVDECNAKYFEGLIDRDTLLIMIARQAVGMVLVDNKADGTSTAAAGIAVRLEDHTADILSLYTLPEYRRKGYASTLLHSMLDALIQNGTVLDVMMFYTDTREHVSLDELMEANGFSVNCLKQSGITKFRLADVSDIPQLQPAPKGRLFPLADTDKRILAEFFRNEPLIQGYLVPDTAAWEQMYLPCSRIYISEGRIRGLLLFSENGDEISLDYAYIKPQVSVVLAVMLSSAAAQLRSSYAPDTVITLAAKDATVTKLVGKLVQKSSWIPLHTAGLNFIEYTNRYIAAHKSPEGGKQ